MEENIKIYFGCSITGGREMAEFYPLIVNMLKHFGRVLTPQFADQSLTTAGTPGKTPFEIYSNDMNWLNEADVAIFEATIPSAGMGFEIGHVFHTRKPHLCLFNPSMREKLSGMIAGNPQLRICEYRRVEELRQVFICFFREQKAILEREYERLTSVPGNPLWHMIRELPINHALQAELYRLCSNLTDEETRVVWTQVRHLASATQFKVEEITALLKTTRSNLTLSEN